MQLGFKQLFFPNKHNDQMLTEGFLDNQQYNRTVIIKCITKFVCSTAILKFSIFKIR